MSDKYVEFSNPENLPVEKLMLSVENCGVLQKIGALNPYWVDNRKLMMYERPPSGSTLVVGETEAWCMRMESYLEDLKWLLRLDHHRFWSTVLHHPQCMDCLVSFLQEADPPYAPAHACGRVRALYTQIRRLVLVVFSRLITNKESKSKWMSKEYLADVIYNKFIFTVPTLWDICLVYGADNRAHVARLAASLFAAQPRYSADAAAAVAFVNETFKYIILQVNKDYDSPEPPNLPETFKGFGDIRRPPECNQADDLTYSILRDIVIHLLDTAMTLRLFVEAYPNSVVLLRKTNFVNSIVQIYEYGIPLLYEKLQEVAEETSVSYKEMEGYLDMARAELIDIFREILAMYKNAILSGEGSTASHVEDYLSVLMDGLAERLLMKDYHACYPVHEDLEMLRVAYPEIDTVKTDYILHAIYSNLDEPVPEHLLNHDHMTNGHEDLTNEEPAPPSSGQSEPTTEHEIPDHIKEESLITEVRDILPHLGDGFILKCLQYYAFDSEKVISSILEGNLAEPLKGLDETLPIIPEDALDQHFLNTGVERLNVFDGDEFDIMTRDDVDLTRIHQGKRQSNYRNMEDMLDDKSEVKQRLDIYRKYNMVYDEEVVCPEDYDDEYDDTYDDDGAGVVPCGDSTDEVRRPFVTPRALQPYPTGREDVAMAVESEEESEHTEDEKAGSSRNKLDFCVNPEERRARREASFQSNKGKGHRPPPKVADVTGKPRGQGQEKEVLVGRDKKEKHKSSRANHSRRQGAQWKRSQGMMPS